VKVCKKCDKTGRQARGDSVILLTYRGCSGGRRLLRSGVTGSGGMALWEIMTGRLRTHFKTLNLTAGQGVGELGTGASDCE
jgi:hypothetical protein